MANRTSCIALAFAAFFLAGATAQDCTTATTQLTACLVYITGPEFTPPSACCQSVMSVNMKHPTCLCTVFGQLDQSNPSVNVTKAYALPTECNVMVNTASCPTFGAPPLAGFAVPPGIAQLSPSPLTMPPIVVDPPSMPPATSAPPTEIPPPVEEPVADGPVSYGPVSADGPAIAQGPGSDDGTGPVIATSGAPAVSNSVILCAVLAGVLALLL